MLKSISKSIIVLCYLIEQHELKYIEDDYTLTDYAELTDKLGIQRDA